jgi:putative membrane protein
MPVRATIAERKNKAMLRTLAALVALFIFLPAVHAAEPPKIVATDVFLRQSVAVLKFETAGSHLALRKTKSDAVLNFAHQLILDYSAAGMKFRQAVTEAKLQMPHDAFDTGHKALFDALSHSPPGKPFAKAYIDAQIEALRDDAAMFGSYAAGGDNERLKFFAQEMVPVLRGHLEQAEKLRR